MGIYYDANCGIGYQVCESSELIEGDDYKDNYDSDFIEYVDRNCCDGFKSFQTGSHLSGNITGNVIGSKDSTTVDMDGNDGATIGEMPSRDWSNGLTSASRLTTIPKN